MGHMKAVQAGYRVEPLSPFLGQPAPEAAPQIDFLTPLSARDERTSLEFFNVMNFVLRFCPTAPSERKLMARFAKIGIGAGKNIDFTALSPEMKQALVAGMDDAWKELAAFEKEKLATGKASSGDLFGTREYLKNNYLYRFAGAVLGIYGNAKEEALYPIYKTDSTGANLDGSNSAYILHMTKDTMPPVHAFWSVTMYKMPESRLVANPIDRYLINSAMSPNLRRDPDGEITIYVQRQSPGADKEANWLPAPNGPFMLAMRLYWPKDEALDGTWKKPPLERIAQ